MAVKHKILVLLVITSLLAFYFTTEKKYTQIEKGTILDPDCGCRYVSTEKVDKQSTCSQRATDRGPQQRVISYSFYGSLTSAYFKGIFENLAGVTQFYGARVVMRLYLDRKKARLDNEENWNKLCSLFCEEPNFDLCDVNSIGDAF